MLSWFRKKSPEPVEDEIDTVMIRRIVGETQTLFLMIAADGGITRAGTGAVVESEPDLFNGTIDPAVFRDLRKRVTPELLAWCGRSPDSPAVAGRACELTVGFSRASGAEEQIEWAYGSKSEGPPAAVERFVAAAVRATDPWYAELLQINQEE